MPTIVSMPQITPTIASIIKTIRITLKMMLKMWRMLAGMSWMSLATRPPYDSSHATAIPTPIPQNPSLRSTPKSGVAIRQPRMVPRTTQTQARLVKIAKVGNQFPIIAFAMKKMVMITTDAMIDSYIRSPFCRTLSAYK